LQRITGKELEWDAPRNALETLVAAMAPIVWVYFALGGLTLIVLRRKHGSQRAPVKVSGYPVTPIIFCLTCLWMGFGAVQHAGSMTLLGLVPMLIGLPFVLGGREASDGRTTL
jgi:APA family basic amino acid/polyamine antiporter